MAAPRRIPFTSIANEELERAYVTNTRHVSPTQRPDSVATEVWERYENGRPWVLLNVGIMGLVLDRPEASEFFARASTLLYDRQSNYWLAAELLGQRGSVSQETAFGRDLIATVAETVEATILRRKGLRSDSRERREPAQLGPEAISLVFCAIARNFARSHVARSVYLENGDEDPTSELLRGVRSADRTIDRRLANLRAIAGRRLDAPANLSSLRALIWGAIGATTIAEDERDTGYAMIGVEPLLDPVTLATAMLVLHEGDLRDEALSPRGELSQARAGLRPRGWDDDVDLASGREAFGLYVEVLRKSTPPRIIQG